MSIFFVCFCFFLLYKKISGMQKVRNTSFHTWRLNNEVLPLGQTRIPANSPVRSPEGRHSGQILLHMLPAAEQHNVRKPSAHERLTHFEPGGCRTRSPRTRQRSPAASVTERKQQSEIERYGTVRAACIVQSVKSDCLLLDDVNFIFMTNKPFNI